MDPLPGYSEDQIHMADYDGDQSQGGWGSPPGGPSQWGSDQQQGPSQWGSDQRQGPSQWGANPDQQGPSQWGSDQQGPSQWSSGNQPMGAGGGPPPLGFGPPTQSGGSGCIRVFLVLMVMAMILSAAGLVFFSKDIGSLFESSSAKPTAQRSTARPRTAKPGDSNKKTEEPSDEEPSDEEPTEEEPGDEEEPRATRKPVAAKIRLGSYSVVSAQDLTGDEVPELLSTRFGDNSALLVVALDGAVGSLLWEQPIKGEDTGQPLVQQVGDVVVAVRGQVVTAFDAADGKQLWSEKLPDSIAYQSVAMAPAKPTVVALHTNDNSLTAFDLKSGKQVWQTTLKETSYKRFQLLGDRACTEGRDETDNIDEVQCYDLASGELREKVQLGEWSDDKAWWPDMYAKEPTLYRFHGQTFETLDLAQVRLADASEVWSRNLGKNFAVPRVEDIPLVQDGNRVAFAAEGNIGIISEGGAPVITTQEEVVLYPLGFDGDLLYVAAIKQRGTRTISVQGLDSATGEVRWQTDQLADADARFGEEEPTWKVVPGVGLIFGWDDGDNDIAHLTLFDAKGEQVWDHQEQLFISEPPAVFGNASLVYGSASSTLIALDPKSGKQVWRIGD